MERAMTSVKELEKLRRKESKYVEDLISLLLSRFDELSENFKMIKSSKKRKNIENQSWIVLKSPKTSVEPNVTRELFAIDRWRRIIWVKLSNEYKNEISTILKKKERNRSRISKEYLSSKDLLKKISLSDLYKLTAQKLGCTEEQVKKMIVDQKAIGEKVKEATFTLKTVDYFD